MHITITDATDQKKMYGAVTVDIMINKMGWKI